MRSGIHPEYVECRVTCSCGSAFTTRSTKPEMHIELCSACHPFYTGKQKYVDTGGRVQRFSDKFGSAAQTVLDREAARRDARQKAHEEARAAAEATRAVRRPKGAQATAAEEVPSEEETPASQEESEE